MSFNQATVDKERKYDRQLRLWGNHGQEALEEAKVCLINATATGTEILKNIVLPGIGSITIIDGKVITGEDAGNNFFLDPERIGESRAKVAVELLLEMNPDVRGDHIYDDLSTVLEADATVFDMFTIVIATGIIEPDVLLKLADTLWKKRIPLMTCVSYGFIGHARLVTEEHCVIESHPDNVHDDLRLDKPFKEFTDFADSIELDKLSYKDHSHTPFVILIHKFLNEWREKYGGNPPKNYSEKNEFKKVIKQAMIVKENGEEEENFLEAVRQVNSALVASCVPPNVRSILSDPKCDVVTHETDNFWVLAKGLKLFVENEGQGLLPLRGSLPDMTSDSDRYIKLQNIYRNKALNDADIVMSYVSEICAGVNASNGRMNERNIKKFCKNAHFLRVIRCRSLTEEYRQLSTDSLELLARDGDSNIVWYVLLRSVATFFAKYRRFPGVDDEQVDVDCGKLKNCVRELLSAWGVSAAMEAIKDDHIQEICRYGCAELHTVAAFMGGIIAHETIKIITKQYVPFNNTLIYSAITNSTSVFVA